MHLEVFRIFIYFKFRDFCDDLRCKLQFPHCITLNLVLDLVVRLIVVFSRGIFQY